MTGEEEATYLGVNVNRLKWIVLSVNVVIVAVANRRSLKFSHDCCAHKRAA
jgi:ABC-type enterobactin transport system permease subunit